MDREEIKKLMQEEIDNIDWDKIVEEKVVPALERVTQRDVTIDFNDGYRDGHRDKEYWQELGDKIPTSSRKP